MMKTACFIPVLLLLPAVAAGAAIYVPDDFTTIQGAINAAAAGDVVIVRPGAYPETIDFAGKAITVRSEQGPGVTAIEGNQAGSVVVFQNGETADSILDGFTVTKGSAAYGGGIHCDNGFPTITNNIITGNTAAVDGGGIYCTGLTPMLVTNNVISGNTARLGAGVHCIGSKAEIINNVISDNTADWGGGGIYCAEPCYGTIAGNLITGNQTLLFEGGGISCYNAGVAIAGNSICGNTGHSHGGGICSQFLFYCHRYDTPDIVGNYIAANSAGVGGGVHIEGGSPQISSNIIVENTATSWGAGIVFQDAYADLINNTLSKNVAGESGGGLTCFSGAVLAVNTILWGNSAPEGSEIFITHAPSKVTIRNSVVKGGLESVHVNMACVLKLGGGMTDADPEFVDFVNNDYHLTWNSPCRNTGDSSVVIEALDFEGDPRIAGSAVDMGADELYFHLYCRGGAVPGGAVDFCVVGQPNKPVLLALGSGVQDPPVSTQYGDLFLMKPFAGKWSLGSVPANGVLEFPATIPSGWSSGDEKPFQALVGPAGDPSSVLTNLMVLEIE